MSTGARIRTTALVAVIVALATVALARAWPDHPGRAFWFWLAACAAGEALWVRLPFGGATLSMASCFNFAALLVLPVGEAMLATALSTFVMELALMRKPVVRALFNAAQTLLAIAAGAAAFAALAGGSRDLVALLSHLRLLPFIAAGGAYYAVNRGLVVLAIAWSAGIPLGEAWRRNFGSAYEGLSSGAVFSLGALLATHYAGIGMVGTLLVALPLVLACDGLRRYTGRMSAAEAPRDDDDHRRAA
jgi:hypothetical protein